MQLYVEIYFDVYLPLAGMLHFETVFKSFFMSEYTVRQDET